MSILRKEDKGGGVMERLTIDDVIEHCKRKTEKYENLNGINTLETADISLSFIKEYWEHRQVKEYLEELKRYRDLEEQGLLLRLPCPIGTTVYNTTWWDYVEEKVKVDGKTFYRTVHKHKVSKSTFSLLDVKDFGKTVFLTKAEAEQKLKEMENDLYDD